jgi:hypothetical protein
MKVTIIRWDTGYRDTFLVSTLPTIFAREIDGYQFLVIKVMGGNDVYIPLVNVAGFDVSFQ